MSQNAQSQMAQVDDAAPPPGDDAGDELEARDDQVDDDAGDELEARTDGAEDEIEAVAAPEDANAAGAADSAGAGQGDDVDPNTHFVFEHKIFAVPGAYFSRPGGGPRAVLNVPLGDVWGAIPLQTLAKEFQIPAQSKDSKLLETVKAGLNFVQEIRPGDCIPKEILDGSASWSVEKRHYVAARMRLILGLVSWLTGNEQSVVEAAELERMAEDPDIKKRAQEAFAEAAEILGLGRDNKEKVVDLVDQMARELSYIEALREYYNEVNVIFQKLGVLSSIYARDQSFKEILTRMRTLMKRPVDQYNNEFEMLDAQTGEVISVLKNFDKQVSYIRKVRDQLHQTTLVWTDVVTQWHGQEAIKDQAVEILMRDTYSFLARNFLVEQRWTMGV